MTTTTETTETQEGGRSGGFLTPFFNILHYINGHIVSLNSSKFFAGLIIILINIGSKFITVQFSKSVEEYLKYTITKQILIFGMETVKLKQQLRNLGLSPRGVTGDAKIKGTKIYKFFLVHSTKSLHAFTSCFC